MSLKKRYYNLYLLILLFTPLLFNTIIKFHSLFTPYTPFITANVAEWLDRRLK